MTPTAHFQVSSLVGEEHERTATTSDLVLDLVFVVVLQRLGLILRDTIEDSETSPTEALRAFFTLFCPLWFIWLATGRWLNLFEQVPCKPSSPAKPTLPLRIASLRSTLLPSPTLTQGDTVSFAVFAVTMFVVACAAIPLYDCGTSFRSHQDELGAWDLSDKCADFSYAVAGGRFFLVLINVYVEPWNRPHPLSMRCYRCAMLRASRAGRCCSRSSTNAHPTPTQNPPPPP